MNKFSLKLEKISSKVDLKLILSLVNAIMGTAVCEELAREGVSGVIAGFTAEDIIHAIATILQRFPRLQLICAHMGGYTEWDEAREYLQHENVMVDCSSSYFVLGNTGLLSSIRFFGADRVLFGSDFPMWDPAEELRAVRALGLTEKELEKVLHRNAELLLKL